MTDQIWEKLLCYPGWCSREKATAIYELTLAIRPKLVVEIGVFGGRSLAAFAFALRDAASTDSIRPEVWGIDPWTNEAALEGENDPANQGWWSKVDMHAVRETAIRRLTGDGLMEWTRIIVAKSESAYPLFSGIDMLHIDGNHNEEVSVKDVNLWVPRLKPKGYLWFDDVLWQQTRKAVERIETTFCQRVRDIYSQDGGCARLYVKNET